MAGVPVFAITDAEIGEVGNVLNSLTEKRDNLRARIQSAARLLEQILDNA